MILTVALFAIVLSVIGSLLNDAARVSRRADRLSWSNQASQWLDEIERDVAGANSLNVAPGGSDTKLEVGLRNLDSPLFLPDPPPDPWNPNAAGVLQTREYEIQGEELVLTITSGGSSDSFVLGPAETFAVERSSDGDVTVTVRKGADLVRREVPPFVMDSERAPL